MLWLKRNLFLAVGGLITFLALACGGYYLWSAKQEDSTNETALQEKKAALDNISRTDPFPSQTNLNIVKGEAEQLRQAVAKLRGNFSAIPVQAVSGQSFATLLNTTTDELRRKADQMGVIIPGKKYSFSFEAQKDKLRFGERSFPALPEQLAEIKVILQILFDAKINKLVNVSRTPVSADDDAARGPNAADYHDLPVQTNAITGTVSRSYRFQFECFSSELATVLENFYKSKYGLHVKALKVESTIAKRPTGLMLPVLTPTPESPVRGPAPGTRPGARGVTAGRGAPAPAVAEVQTVLSEHLLKADMVVEVIQPGK
jgi:hypothetical protein